MYLHIPCCYINQAAQEGRSGSIWAVLSVWVLRVASKQSDQIYFVTWLLGLRSSLCRKIIPDEFILLSCKRIASRGRDCAISEEKMTPTIRRGV